MPRDGAWWLSEVRGHQLNLVCEKCGRRAQFDASSIYAEIGDITVPNLLDVLAKRDGCKGVGSDVWNDKCQASLSPSPAELMGATNETARQSLGHIPDWYVLGAECSACGDTRPLDRRALLQRFGPSADIEGIAKKLRCARCGNREGNHIVFKKMPR